METRKGRQTPTQSVVLPYSKTLGQDAVDLYNRTGRTAQEWQELLLSDILAVNDEGLWVHTKYGYSVPRRNGKNEVIKYDTPNLEGCSGHFSKLGRPIKAISQPFIYFPTIIKNIYSQIAQQL